jgi:hypothetical protein
VDDLASSRVWSATIALNLLMSAQHMRRPGNAAPCEYRGRISSSATAQRDATVAQNAPATSLVAVRPPTARPDLLGGFGRAGAGHAFSIAFEFF